MQEILRAHEFSDEDIWDIGAIAGFFALSNRLANMMSLRPNDEFYLMGGAEGIAAKCSATGAPAGPGRYRPMKPVSPRLV